MPVTIVGPLGWKLSCKGARYAAGHTVNMRKRRGAAVVEFAIITPIFFLLVFGMLEYGRLVQVSQVTTNASREGARYASACNAKPDDARAWAKTYLQNSGIDPAVAQVDISPAQDGQPITCRVTVPYSQVSWFPPFWLKDRNVESTSTMLRETNYSN